MDDRLRGFGGNAYTLKIGQDQEELLVPGNILTLVPYFKKALSSGSFTESTTKTFELPDDDPKAVADVLYYAYTGQVPAVPYHPATSREDAQGLEPFLRAYITADKYKAESTSNKLVDRIIEFQSGNLMNPGTLWILGDAGLHDTPLYKLMAKEMMYQLQFGGYDADWDVYFLGTDQETSTFAEACRRLSKEDMVHIMTYGNGLRYGWKDSCPALEASKNLCSYHKHEISEPCV